jgi:hypothetical protein
MSVHANPYPTNVQPRGDAHVEDASREAFHPQRGPMPMNTTRQTNPLHDERGPMPNDDNAMTAALNPNGNPMTETRTNPTAPENPNPEGSMPPDQPPDYEPIPDTLRMLTHDDAARAALAGVASELGTDELRVLTRIAERLHVGSHMYGPFYLATDARVFRDKEAREELEDALVYLACAWLKAETREVA